MTIAERQTCERAAKLSEEKLSAWIRRKLVRAAKREIENNERREGATIPWRRTQTPPAGYKAAAPPRRGPLCRVGSDRQNKI